MPPPDVEAKGIVVKTKGKSGPNRDAKDGSEGESREKWVRRFEWSLTTLLSLACLV